MKIQKHEPATATKQPIFLQILLLVALIIIGAGVGGGIVQILGNNMGFNYTSIIDNLTAISPLEQKNFIRISLGINQLCSFLLPAILFSIIVAKKNWTTALQLSNFPKRSQICLGALFILLAFPVAHWIHWLNSQLPLPNWAMQQEDLINNTIFSLLKIAHPSELFINLFVIGILPAIGEELVFRGIFQQKLTAEWNNPHLAIWATAILFSFIHLQFEGFFPRVFLGATLGYLFFWTNNLWIPIIAHFLFNASQVVIQHLYYIDYQQIINLEELEQLPFWVTGIAIVGMVVVGGLLRSSRKKRSER